MCPEKNSLVAIPTQLVTRDRVFCQQIKTAFHGEDTKTNCTTNWCAAHDSKDSINKSIQDYELWTMPYDHAYDPKSIILPIQVFIINPLPRKCYIYILVIGVFFVHCLRLKE